MPSKFFKQRQKQRALDTLRQLPKPMEAVVFAQQLLPRMPMMPPVAELARSVAEAAPDGGMILPEEDVLEISLDRNLRLIYSNFLPPMPMPIKIHTA